MVLNDLIEEINNPVKSEKINAWIFCAKIMPLGLGSNTKHGKNHNFLLFSMPHIHL
jgi:hypothetical protein